MSYIEAAAAYDKLSREAKDAAIKMWGVSRSHPRWLDCKFCEYIHSNNPDKCALDQRKISELFQCGNGYYGVFCKNFAPRFELIELIND